MADFDYLAIDWRKNVRSRFHGFNYNDFFVFSHCRADIRQFDKNDVAQLCRGMLGDADDDNVAFHPEPFVFFGKFHCWGPFLIV